jgi:cytidyltransferase-like protein
MKTVAISGYFDPIHIGHIEYIRLASELGDKLIVIINNDYQCMLKKGGPFQTEKDREIIVGSLRWVDETIISIDRDQSQRETLRLIKPDIFANGGDRFVHEIPEAEVCKELDIQIIDGLGEKIRSSSELLARIKT